MTRAVNARLAGFTFLFYIVAGIASMGLAGHQNARSVLGILTSLCALVLGVTLYAITRDEDPDLALLALGCRFIEAIPYRGNVVSFLVPFLPARADICSNGTRRRRPPLGLASRADE